MRKFSVIVENKDIISNEEIEDYFLSFSDRDFKISMTNGFIALSRNITDTALTDYEFTENLDDFRVITMNNVEYNYDFEKIRYSKLIRIDYKQKAKRISAHSKLISSIGGTKSILDNSQIDDFIKIIGEISYYLKKSKLDYYANIETDRAYIFIIGSNISEKDLSEKSKRESDRKNLIDTSEFLISEIKKISYYRGIGVMGGILGKISVHYNGKNGRKLENFLQSLSKQDNGDDKDGMKIKEECLKRGFEIHIDVVTHYHQYNLKITKVK